MLSESELKLLKELAKRRTSTAEELANALNLPVSTIASVSALLKQKGYVDVIERETDVYELTPEGKERLEKGLPEEVLISVLGGKPATIEELRQKMGKDLDIAISWGKRKRLIEVEKNVVKPLVQSYDAKEKEALSDPTKGDEETLKTLVSRGLLKRKKRKEMIISLIKEPAEETQRQVITVLTSDVIRTKSWKNAIIRPYNVEAYPGFYPLGKKHFFREFLERIRDVMVSLGFSEVSGDYVELELYNFDLLFQPQDHPAREIHDSFSLGLKGNVKSQELMERVKKMHEAGWKYSWNPEVALRLMLRSQTTAVTARVLAQKPKPPLRVFTIGKVFRPDTIDATHLIEFHQLDGLVIEEGYSFRDLLGDLKEIFFRMGVKEVKFKPAYFPFTEPSVEVYGRIEGLGWVEMCGAGMLRDEILRTVGVTAPAGAWGIGLDRLAMFFNQLNDIRLLYSYDAEFLRNVKVRVDADDSG
ncbi:MAG: phenylalanine--tRNA ligase subunit alpha [Thermoprotei archaeon]